MSVAEEAAAARITSKGSRAEADQRTGSALTARPSDSRAAAAFVVTHRCTLSDGVELELLDTGVREGHQTGEANAARAFPLEVPAVGVGGSRPHDARVLPLLLLHGFTGAAHTWTELLPVLGEHRRVLALSLPGHGGSDAPSEAERYAATRAAADVMEVLDMLGLNRVALLGYSMGARVALHAALAAPERVVALLLESASPGIADDADRSARAGADSALADEIEGDGVTAFVDRWERLPLWESQRALPETVRQGLRDQRLQNDARGLSSSLRGLGAGVTPPLHGRLHEILVPTLLLCGELDGKYVSLARAMASAIPRSTLAVVSDAGHAVHLERPQEFIRAVNSFLDDVGELA